MEKEARFIVVQGFEEDLIGAGAEWKFNDFVVWDTSAGTMDLDLGWYGQKIVRIHFHELGDIHGIKDRAEAEKLAQDIADFLNARENPSAMCDLALDAVKAMEEAHKAHKKLVDAHYAGKEVGR